VRPEPAHELDQGLGDDVQGQVGKAARWQRWLGVALGEAGIFKTEPGMLNAENQREVTWLEELIELERDARQRRKTVRPKGPRSSRSTPKEKS